MAARHLIIVMDLKAFHLGQFLLSSHTGKVTQDDLLCDFALCSETSRPHCCLDHDFCFH